MIWSTVFSAIKDFKLGPFDGFVPNYVDEEHEALAINAREFPGKKSAAEMKYEGNPGTFDLALMTMTETDGKDRSSSVGAPPGRSCESRASSAASGRALGVRATNTVKRRSPTQGRARRTGVMGACC